MEPLFSIQVFVAVFGSLLAAVWDMRTGRVPNRLSFSMMALGFILCLLNFDLSYFLIWSANFGAAFLLAYVLWRFGAWAGGDAKLFWGVVSLVPSYPLSSSFSSLSSVFNILLWLATLLLIRFSVRSIRVFVRTRDLKKLAYLASKPVLVTLAVVLFISAVSNNFSALSLGSKSFFFIFLFTSYRIGRANDKKETIKLTPYISAAFVLSLFFDLVGLVV